LCLQDGGVLLPCVHRVVSLLKRWLLGTYQGAVRAAFAPVTSTAQGIARIEGLLPGRYRIQAEFPGFDTAVLPEVRVRRGDNKHVLVVPLKKREESVTVAQNAQSAAADPRGNAFKTVLTAQEIESLSDDPTEMAQQLQDLAGGNATIRVDSFAGAPLPPKASRLPVLRGGVCRGASGASRGWYGSFKWLTSPVWADSNRSLAVHRAEFGKALRTHFSNLGDVQQKATRFAKVVTTA
jgi:hypothetical protein